MRCACCHVDGTILDTLSEINPRTIATHKNFEDDSCPAWESIRIVHSTIFNILALVFSLTFSLCLSPVTHSRSLRLAAHIRGCDVLALTWKARFQQSHSERNPRTITTSKRLMTTSTASESIDIYISWCRSQMK